LTWTTRHFSRPGKPGWDSMKSWAFLITAIVLEVGATTCVKLSAGFTRLIPSVLLFVLYGLSFVFLTLAVKTIEISVVYAIWSGLGTALIAVIGITWFHESFSVSKMFFLCLIVVGVVGLQMTGQSPH
jgi:small multidrug resistance pump